MADQPMTDAKAKAIEDWSRRIYDAAERAVMMLEMCVKDDGSLSMSSLVRITYRHEEKDEIVRVSGGLEHVHHDD